MKHWPFYVYIHRRADTGAPFYVGRGTSEFAGMYGRAHGCDRSIGWGEVATEAGGIVVEIFAHCPTEEAAILLEHLTMHRLAKDHAMVNVVGLVKSYRDKSPIFRAR